MTQAEDILVEQSLYAVEGTFAAQCVDKLQQSIFALAADHVVDVARIQSSIGIDRREIASQQIGTSGCKRRISREVSIAATICGPGMADTPSSST